MSEVQGSTAGSTAAAGNNNGSGSDVPNHESPQLGNGRESNSPQAPSGSAVQSANPVDGKSVTGSPDSADKAAAAVKQGRELTSKELSIPVTRTVMGQKITKTIGEWIGASQLEQASYQRFQQANEAIKQADQIVKAFKSSPADFMRRAGINPDDFAKAHLAQQLEMLGMSEEQKELYQLREEKKQRELQEQQAAEAKKQQEMQAKDTAEYNQMVKNSLEAWKDSGLPDDPYWGQRMAAEVARHQIQGIQLTWKEAAAIVKQDWIASNRRILDSFNTIEDLVNHLGEGLLKKIRDYEIGRVTAKAASRKSPQRPGGSPASQKSQQPTYVNEQAYDAYWERKRAEYDSN